MIQKIGKQISINNTHQPGRPATLHKKNRFTIGMIEAQPGWPALVKTFQKQNAEISAPTIMPGSEVAALYSGIAGIWVWLSCAKNTNGMRLIRDIIMD